MSRAYKGLEVTIYGKVSERSAGEENVAYLQEKLKSMKMADLVRYLVGVARRYETGELFGAEVKRILAELPGNGALAQTEPVAIKKEPAAAGGVADELPRVKTDDDLINDLLDSIEGLG
jgi:hypothetical protein